MKKWSLVLLGLMIGCSSAEHRPATELPATGAAKPIGASMRVTPTPQASKVAGNERLSNLHHRVNTTNAAAQQHFDDGLTLCYAFNHDEAIRSFEKALTADPKLAMAHWGIAYALGPNYNVD